MKKKVENWISRALTDLKTAKKLIEDEELTTSTVFHCQQCVEKCLKAMIENLDVPVLKSHNLPNLLGKIDEFYDFEIDKDMLSQINDVYIDSRYPGELGIIPEGRPSLEKARSYIKFADGVYKKTQAVLKQNQCATPDE